MLLFAITLILAALTVGVSVFLGVGSTYLQTTYTYALAAVMGAVGLVGLLIALLDRGREKAHRNKTEPMREGESALQWSPPGAAKRTRQTAPAPAPAPRPEPVAAPEPVAPTEVSAPVAQDTMPFPQEESVVEDTAVAEEVVETEVVVEAEEAAPEAPVVESLPPADHVLYLDPDVDLSEIKRVFNIWQMTFDDAELPNGQRAHWIAPDSTTIDFFEVSEGFPYLEIRGPMASELAEFLPQDLPIHVELPE